MAEYDEDYVLVRYVLQFYEHLMTPVEQRALRAVFLIAKAAAGHEMTVKDLWQHQIGDDFAVLDQLADGVETFRRRTASRLLREHGVEVFVNRCARCNRVVATPKARQCLWCGFDWHMRPSGDGNTP